MKERFYETIESIIISSLIAFIVGLIMIIFPQLSIETFGIVVAVCIILFGISFIYLDIKTISYYFPFEGFITGTLSILLGVYLLCKPSVVPVMLTIVIGIWMIITSINYIKMALKLSRTKLPWIQILILGILDLIVGFIVILNPFEATVSLTLFVGIMLIIHSIITIIDVLIIRRDVKEISLILDKKLKEITK